jgi:hypothetical protein
MNTLPIQQLRYSSATWPRLAVNNDRVEMFAAQLADGETLPPIEVVPNGDGTFSVADGVHRTLAALLNSQTDIEVKVVTVGPGESALNCAYRRALETATRTALPLGKLERRRAVKHLLDTRPDLSRREIARWVGVAHSTVDRWASEVADSASDSEVSSLGPTADQSALKLVRFLERLSDSRGLFDYVAPKRMGRYLAQAFYDRFEDEALSQARVFALWVQRAVTLLEGQGSQ